MAEPARHLREVKPGMNPASGEIVPECPGCLDREHEIKALQATIRSLSAKVRYARQDADAKARGDALWPKAHELFDYHQEHPRRRKRRSGRKARFTPDRFRLVAPFIREEGLEDCKRAIDGLMESDWHREHKLDEFERPFSASQNRTAQSNFEKFRDAGVHPMVRFLEVVMPPAEGWLGSDYVLAQLAD